MLTEKELKLAVLAMDPAAADGEWKNAATLFFQTLRKRQAPVNEVLIGSNAAIGDPLVMPQTVADWGLTICPFKKHKGEMFRDIDPSYLRWCLGWIGSEPGLQAKFGDIADAIRAFFKQSGSNI